ncbi:MAG: sporulation initiation factor Spo0A C-terminal domain-containing protein [Oscillospiraceae bacterium]
MDRPLSVLLVEDDQAACRVFIEYADGLADISLVGVTNNSSKAVELIRTCIPDAVILDLELHQGSGNGLLVLQELACLAPAERPYILITTNNSSAVTYEAARRLGADFILSKHQENYSPEGAIDFLRMMGPVIFAKSQLMPQVDATTETAEQYSKRLFRRISAELDHIGISPKALGYQYLIEGIKLEMVKPTQNVCDIIGKKYGKTESSVERAIQNALNKAWRTADINDLLTYYTAKISSAKGVPTIAEFICYYAGRFKNGY